MTTQCIPYNNQAKMSTKVKRIIEEANENQRELDLVSLNISTLDDISNVCKWSFDAK